MCTIALLWKLVMAILDNQLTFLDHGSNVWYAKNQVTLWLQLLTFDMLRGKKGAWKLDIVSTLRICYFEKDNKDKKRKKKKKNKQKKYSKKKNCMRT